MFSFNEYSHRTQLPLNQLKYDIDKKISKISWMIKEKQKRNKQKVCSSPAIVLSIGVQTIGQYHLSSSRQASLLIDKLMESSRHTKACSNIAISTNDCTSLNRINFLTQTQNSSDVSFQNMISVRTSGIRSDNQSNFRSSREDVSKIKEIKETRDIQINTQPITEKEIKSPIKQQPEDQIDDSLDVSFERKKRLEQKQDEKFFTQQNLKQSLIVSISSVAQQKKAKKELQQNQNKIMKPEKSNNKTPIKTSNKLSVNKINNKKQVPKKQPVPRLPLRKQSSKKDIIKNREDLHKKKQNIKEKIVTKNKSTKKTVQCVKSQGNAVDNQIFFEIENSMNTEFNDNIVQDLNLRQKKTTSFKQLPPVPLKIKQTARKTLISQKSPVKSPSEKIIVSPQVKERMKSLVAQITPRDRKEDNDSAVRLNLLKRIEDKHKPIKN